MLSSFKIQNFRSILDLHMDFTYGEGKAPNGYQNQEVMPFLETSGKQRFVPCMAFFGANASGKTNILKAYWALHRLVVKDGIQLNSVYEPNLLNSKYKNTALAIEFVLGNDVFEYQVRYSASEIIEEVLRINAKTLFAIHQLKAEFSDRIVSSSYTKEKLSDILRVECSDGANKQIKLFLQRIGFGYRGLHSDLRNVFKFFIESVSIYGNEKPILLPEAVDLLASDLNGDDDEALKAITDIVRRLDIDISKLEITQMELLSEDEDQEGITKVNLSTGEKHSVQIVATHMDINGKPALLDFVRNESAGTQRLAGLIGLILHTLKTGGVLLIDELECSMHPILMREIVLLFKKRSHNMKGAQLIFTTHNTDILDDSILRVSEIAMVRKTTANGTMVKRLVDGKKHGEDIRNVTNFRKQYLAGFYSGVPHPAL